MKHALSKFSPWCAVRLLAIVLLSVSARAPEAQSVTYFGANNDARACHEGAQRSARTHLADTEALHRCTIALNHGRLKAHNREATYVNRGILRAGLGQYRAAMGDYQSAENLYPAYTEILVNRGNVFFLTRVFPDVIEQYSEALARQTPAAYISYINRGMSYEKLGDYSAAGDDYRQALKLVPGWEIAEQKLTRLELLKTGEIGHMH